ncbi:MAG: hypothetical protein ACE5H5_01825 [Nitrospinota bacterium]
MMRWLLLGLACALTLASTTACAPPAAQLQTVKLGMTKDDVIKNLGPPTAVKGTITNQFGQKIEVVEYMLALPDDPDTAAFKTITATVTAGLASPAWLVQNTKPFWLYFLDAKLAKWEEAGDWNEEAKRLVETRMQEIPCCL